MPKPQIPRDAEETPLVPIWCDDETQFSAAVALGMSRDTAYKLAQRGKFPVEAVRLAGRWRVRTTDLRRYLGLD